MLTTVVPITRESDRSPAGSDRPPAGSDRPPAGSDLTGMILDRIRQVPAGYVRTYGDVSPGAPRKAGAVLSACTDPSVPWYRIVRADGSLAQGRRQRELLHREGVPFRGDRVDMAVARLPEGAIDVTVEDLLPERLSGPEPRRPRPRG